MSSNNSPDNLGLAVGTANLVGVLLSTITFGAHLTLFMHLVVIYIHDCARARRKRDTMRKQDWQLLVYICMLFVLSSVGLCLQTWVNHDAFILHQSFPGGPFAYLRQQARSPVNLAMTMIYIVLNWFADGMLLYRTCVLFKFSRIILAICAVALLALLAVGSAFLQDIGMLGLNVWTSSQTAPPLAYLSLSFSINLVLTLVIVLRLLHVRRELIPALGSRHTRVYTSIVAMLVESASLYTIVTLLSIIACALRKPLQNALLPMLGQLQAIPPLLITLRVKTGRAVTAETWADKPMQFLSCPEEQCGSGVESECYKEPIPWERDSHVFPSPPCYDVMECPEKPFGVRSASRGARMSLRISIDDALLPPSRKDLYDEESATATAVEQDFPYPSRHLEKASTICTIELPQHPPEARKPQRTTILTPCSREQASARTAENVVPDMASAAMSSTSPPSQPPKKPGDSNVSGPSQD
ncbi:hypothetical protein OH77DRAFT_1517031 [Trametes cingulata]|nr:hypothetical protein OH77DRAFT_1517031 [Trametes cingulata]